MPLRHFLRLPDLTPKEILGIIDRAIEMKRDLASGQSPDLLRHRSAVMIFEMSSTRTRVSFETGITQLGGNAIFLAPNDSQLGRGEPIEDTARVLSRMAELIVVRTGSHSRLERLAEFSSVPVINGLSDFNHPCQLLADLQTWQEYRGAFGGRTAAWIGDGNNVCHSWMNAARMLDFELRIAAPEGYLPDAELLAHCGDSVKLGHDPVAAVRGVDLVVTDTWASMGQEDQKMARADAFASFKVDEALMREAADDALFMHCLPAYRDFEVTSAVIDGPQSVVWDEAENRLHAQKALMEFLLTQKSI